MSVKKYVVIEIDCGECSSTYREDFLDSGSKIQVQKQAMRDGWIISGGGRRCLCPRCVERKSHETDNHAK